MNDGMKALLAPRSIAILGASQDLNKLSGRPIKFLLKAGYKGAIYPINPKYAEIAGLRCYPDLEAVPGPVDLGIVGLPASGVIGAIRAMGKKGVPAAVVFASGYGETGAEGRALEDELIAEARQNNVRICGPNGLGLINAFDGVMATFSQYGYGDTPAGPVGFVTQSGALGTAISALARGRDLGLGYFVNNGNEADVTFVDAMEAVLDDPRIKVGTGYIEGLKDGEGFCRVAARAMESGTPLAILKVGRTDAGARAASSHTGSLAGQDTVFDAVARQFGVIRVRDERHMLDVAEVASTGAVPKGRGVAIVTQSGGAGVMMADRAEELGLKVPVLSNETKKKLATVLPAFGAMGNPVDVTAQFIAEPSMLRDSVKFVLEDDGIDVVVVWFQLMNQFVDRLLDIFSDLKKTCTKPIVVAWVAGPADGMKALRKLGIPVLDAGEAAIDAVAGLVRFSETRGHYLAEKSEAVRTLPALVALPAGPVPSLPAAMALSAFGVIVAASKLASDAEGAVRAANQIGYPVVMKIESPDLPHKTEAGGVRLGVADEAAVRTAFAEIVKSAKAHKKDARIDGVLVQAMARGGTEVVLGLRRDPVFGMMVMAGLGGIFVEVLKDVSFRKAPVTAPEAGRMLAELKGHAVLKGARGREAANETALIDLIVKVSEFGAAHADTLDELDLNPVMTSAAGAVAVDWLMIGRAKK